MHDNNKCTYLFIFQAPRPQIRHPAHPAHYSSQPKSGQIHVAKTTEDFELIKASVRATANRVENAKKDLEKTLETREQVEKLKERLKTKKRGISETENNSGEEETVAAFVANEQLVNDVVMTPVCDDTPVQLPINDNNT